MSSRPQKSSNLCGDLHAAARSGDLVAVQSICSSNPLAINSRDRHSRTPYPPPIAWAGQTQVVNYLCKNKGDVGAAAMDDMGAIHFASQKGHLEVVRVILSSGVSIKATNRKGMTALHYAVQGSYLELVKYLVKKGASLSAKTKAGKVPLDLATDEEVRSFLVESGRSCDNKEDLNGEQKAEKAHPEPLLQEKAEISDGEASISRQQEEENEKDESVKRRADSDNMKENSPKPKKAKVALNHLLTSDDIQEEEENL